jgi:hypothetical protein
MNSAFTGWYTTGLYPPTGTSGYTLRYDGTNQLPQVHRPVVAALRYRSTDIDHTQSGDWVQLALNLELYDHDSILNSTTTITVPSGYTWMKVQGNIRWDGNATGVRAVRLVDSGGSNLTPSVQTYIPAASSVVLDVPFESYWVPVTGAETYSIETLQSSGDPLAIRLGSTYLNVEFK